MKIGAPDFRAYSLASRMPPVGYNSGNEASPADPARGPRKLTSARGNLRKATVETPCSRRESPHMPAQAGSDMTGLSRREVAGSNPVAPAKTFSLQIARLCCLC
jgi:hypothetical protein